MSSLGMHMLASSLAVLAWVSALLTCILPMWRVTAYIGTTIVTSQVIWEGIWVTCVAQSTGQVMCKPYPSTLALGKDLQAARALTVMALLAGSGSLLLAFVGGKCTRFLEDDGQGPQIALQRRTRKEIVLLASGVAMVVAGLLCIIPVSWTAGAVVRNFYNPQLTDSQRRELGAAIYLGWGAAILFFLAGGMFCSTWCLRRRPSDDDRHNAASVKYVLVRSSVSGGGGSRHTPGPGAPSVLRSQPPQGGGMMRAPPHQTLTAKPPLSQAPSTASYYSRAPSTKSQLPGPKFGSGPPSEVSEGPSTKSQLKRMDSAISLEEFVSKPEEQDVTLTTPTDEPPLSPTKTYL